MIYNLQADAFDDYIVDLFSKNTRYEEGVVKLTPPISFWERATESSVDVPDRIMNSIKELDGSGKRIAAADLLLGYIVDLLDAKDLSSLDCLIELQNRSLVEDVQIYDDRGLARIHNVLALTFHHASDLAHRSALRNTYRNCVAKREGTTAADNAVANL